MENENTDVELTALLDYLKRSRGFDFTGYKQLTLLRRIQKRMETVDIQSYRAYIEFLEVHPEEFTQLFNTILINVTSFFRDSAAWDYLRDEIIPRLLAAKSAKDPVRIWSTACASGEEAYSIAMLLCEALGEEQFRERVKIYATDVDEDALAKARLAVYTAKEVENVPEDLREKYFYRLGPNYGFRKEMRRNLIFGRNDLIQDAPISRVDLLICRNALMYFTAETQSKILARFHFAMLDAGFLFLGKAEMLLTHTNTFTPVNIKLRIFSKVAKTNLRDRLLQMATAGSEENLGHPVTLIRLREAAFEYTPVAQLVVDLANTLVVVNEAGRDLFALSNRDIGRPFQDLEISFRPIELRGVIQRVLAEQRPVVQKDIEWISPAGENRRYDIHVQQVSDNGNLLGVSIAFIDGTTHKLLQQKLEQAHQELETAFEELQSTNEELETTNEELQSTIEELETTNEELQSTNEELETMNEELQSTNEELSTINDEMHDRTEELNRVNTFLEAILTSVHAGVVVLDSELRVQVWNGKSEDLWGLRAEEAQGKNLLSLDIGLPTDQLRRPFRLCLSGEADWQQVEFAAHNRRGKLINCRVTLTPLLSPQRDIVGVITLIEDLPVEAGPDGTEP